MSDDVRDYDYVLPEELIARHPPAEREAARLLVVSRGAATWSHRGMRELPELLLPGDCLVLNNTRVIPARLLGQRTNTGGHWEGLYLGPGHEPAEWRLLCQTRGRLRAGEMVTLQRAGQISSAAFGETLQLRLIEKDAEGVWRAMPLVSDVDTLAILEHFGTVPLPPYMQRELAEQQDVERYQTTFAEHPGSVAAPTAGLHFTPELLQRCEERGISHTFVTLHVGIGTFRPMSVERLSEHVMHAEWCDVSAETVARLQQTRSQGGRIVAVGTTSVRTLETASQSGELQPFRGPTNLFIRPPYAFRSVDVLLTNFHLPRSTLLVLVSTFAGRELIQQAYAAAIAERYRFYSYGDAMLIEP